MFASKYAFFCIFQDLQENHLLASKFCKILQKVWQNFTKFEKKIQNFYELFKNLKILPKFCQNFAKICQNLPKFCKICSREDDFLVDLEKCCKMRPWLQKSASIQPRTSPGKSDVKPFADDRDVSPRERVRWARPFQPWADLARKTQWFFGDSESTVPSCSSRLCKMNSLLLTFRRNFRFMSID